MTRIVFLQKFLPQEMLGIAYLSRALRNAGHEVAVQMVPEKDWIAQLREKRPDIIGVSCTTGDHRFYTTLLERAKDATGAFVIMGGPHPTFVPSIVNERPVDAICRGEGERALVDLADRMKSGADITNISNLTVRRGTRVFENPVRPLVATLDELGMPDRSPLYEAAACYREAPRKIFLTQRGCPNACSFCFHHAWRDKLYKVKNNTYVRKRSVDGILNEIEDVRSQHGLKFIHFLDDIFNIDDEWLERFCTEYPRRIGLPFDVILRTNLTTDTQMRWLRHAGCISARLAFESASDRVRNKIYRKGTSMAHLENSARYVRSQGIRLTTLNLLGAPGATLDDELETVALNVRCKVDHPLCSLLQPYPETDIADITKDLGYAVDKLEHFPEKFNRTSSIQREDRHSIENLHKLFPILVRFPALMPLARPLAKIRLLSPVYLAAYLLWTEYLVCEQNRSWAVATNTARLSNLPAVDFLRRVCSKTTLKIKEQLFGRSLTSMARLRLAMQTDTIAHADG